MNLNMSYGSKEQMHGKRCQVQTLVTRISALRQCRTQGEADGTSVAI